MDVQSQNIRRKSEAYASEYCMSAGDNSLSRVEINESIVSEATANEHSFRRACRKGLEKNLGQKTRL